MALAEIGGDVVEIGHGLDIEPDIRHRHHDIGVAEAEPGRDSSARAFRRPASRAADPRQ